MLLNARHCRDTKGCCSLLWYFHSIINTGVVFPSGVSSHSVRHPLPLSCQHRCQTGTAAGLSPSRPAVWCLRNSASSPAPGRCLRGKDASAATRALLLLCLRGSAAVSTHVFVKDFPRLHCVQYRKGQFAFLTCLVCTAACTAALSNCLSSTGLSHSLPLAEVWGTFPCCPQQLSGAGT